MVLHTNDTHPDGGHQEEKGFFQLYPEMLPAPSETGQESPGKEDECKVGQLLKAR